MQNYGNKCFMQNFFQNLGTWRIFTWEVGTFSLGKLAQNPNMFYPPNLSNSSL